MATTRDTIATIKHLKTRTRLQRRTRWAGETMDSLNEGVGPYQFKQQIIIETFDLIIDLFQPKTSTFSTRNLI